MKGLMITILIVGIACAAGCAPPEGVGGVAVDAVDAAHERAKLMESSAEAQTVPDPMAGIDPRLADLEQRVDGQSKSVAALVASVTTLADRVDVLENLPQAPAPAAEELDAVRTEQDRQGEQIAALLAKLNGCQCGPDCTCGPDCKCPDGCDPDCPCQQTAKAESAAAAATSEKPYASVTLLSLPGCPPCEQWKREVLPELKAKGWAFTEETLASGRAPQFRICIGDACYIHHGFLTGSDLAAILRQHNGESDPLRSTPLRNQGATFTEPAAVRPTFGGRSLSLFGRRFGG